jgi:major vault protein
MQNDVNRERDLVLAPNEFAFISDQTKGNINVYVGPYKTSLANTDKPVIFEEEQKKFIRCNLDEAIQTFGIAPEGWYIVMKNPPKDGLQPRIGTSNTLSELNVGRKVNIPGPISFALWPGQMVRVIPGHRLRSNQYLLVRVYDEQEARKNWAKAVVKTKSGEEEKTISADEIPDLTTGKYLIIKGTDVSFYIPPTGIEVVRDENGEYVREAVTLERLEYCILLDEDGNKRFVKGTAVVFPEPTEMFVLKNGHRKFRAIELNENSGLYIKVIAPYTEDKRNYKIGEELFITGKDQMIYFPRPEHAIVKYGQQEIYHAVAIPEGEGRYFLDRNTGKINLKKGPCMFLPDPREAVIVRRVLDPRLVELWFPGNKEALEYNVRLKQLCDNEKMKDFVVEQEVTEELVRNKKEATSSLHQQRNVIINKIAGDEFRRKDESQERPRTLTLYDKYDGAVTFSVWTGYAVLVVSKIGARKVIAGPQTYLLEYDETLQAVELSTGTPKTDDQLFKTVYLRVLNNKVSDIVTAESADFCQVNIHLSYRVNFEGDPDKWFNVENYVKFLTDHLRSVIRNAVKKINIMDFYANGISIIRDTVLGVAAGEDNKRAGRAFKENGMRIYDVEVFDIKLGDEKIEQLLVSSQQDLIRQTIAIAAERRKLNLNEETEDITRKIAENKAQTKQRLLELERTETAEQLKNILVKIDSEIQSKQKTLDAQVADQEKLAKINEGELHLLQTRKELELQLAQKALDQRLAELQAEVTALVSKAQAVSPQLVAALQAFSDRALAEKVADSMAPLSILGGKSVAEIFSGMLQGTVLGNVLDTTLE